MIEVAGERPVFMQTTRVIHGWKLSTIGPYTNPEEKGQEGIDTIRDSRLRFKHAILTHS